MRLLRGFYTSSSSAFRLLFLSCLTPSSFSSSITSVLIMHRADPQTLRPKAKGAWENFDDRLRSQESPFRTKDTRVSFDNFDAIENNWSSRRSSRKSAGDDFYRLDCAKSRLTFVSNDVGAAQQKDEPTLQSTLFQSFFKENDIFLDLLLRLLLRFLNVAAAILRFHATGSGGGQVRPPMAGHVAVTRNQQSRL